MDVNYVPGRKAERPAKVIGLRDALIVAATCTGLFGGITIFALRALIRDEINVHNNDGRAHTAVMEPVRDHISRQSAEAGQMRELLDRMGRIESKVNESSESVARIEERLAISNQRRK